MPLVDFGDIVSFLSSTEFLHFMLVVGGEDGLSLVSSSASLDGSPISVDSSVFASLTLFLAVVLRLLATVVFLFLVAPGELSVLDDGLSFTPFADLLFVSEDLGDTSAGNLSGVSFSFFTGEAALLTSGESDGRLFFPFAATELKTSNY